MECERVKTCQINSLNAALTIRFTLCPRRDERPHDGPCRCGHRIGLEVGAMELLGKIKIIYKILLVIGMMAATSAFLSYLGTTSLASLNDATDRMERVSSN